MSDLLGDPPSSPYRMIRFIVDQKGVNEYTRPVLTRLLTKLTPEEKTRLATTLRYELLLAKLHLDEQPFWAVPLKAMLDLMEERYE